MIAPVVGVVFATFSDAGLGESGQLLLPPVAARRGIISPARTRARRAAISLNGSPSESDSNPSH